MMTLASHSFRISVFFVAVVTLVVCCSCTADAFSYDRFKTTANFSVPWTFAGPGGGLGIQPGNTMAVSSAISIVVQSGSAFLVGLVNGGVFRTTDKISKAVPHWTPVSDVGMTCSAIATMHVSTTNPLRVYAGCGATSSSLQGYAWNVVNDAGWTGFGVSLDGGVSWQMAPGFPRGYSLEGILELPTGELLVSARGSYTNQTDGGIWRSTGGWNSGVWTRVYGKPVFGLVYDNVSNTVFASGAAVAASMTVMGSKDKGATWQAWSKGLGFIGNADQAFYTCFSILPGRHLFLGVFLSTSQVDNAINAGLGAGLGLVAYLDISGTPTAATATWKTLGGQPMRANPVAPTTECCNTPGCCTWPQSTTGGASCCWSLEGDFSAKDRMAVLIDVDRPDKYLYVVANGGFEEYRVDWPLALQNSASVCTLDRSSTATKPCLNKALPIIWQPLTNKKLYPNGSSDAEEPHVDTRSLAWAVDDVTGEKVMLMTSDGGIFKRYKAWSSAGYWRDWVGDLAAFEYVHASLDTTRDIWIAAAQDNTNMIASSASNPAARAYGSSLWGGDGQWTGVDTSTSPPRFYGNIQNLYQFGYVAPTLPLSVAGNNKAKTAIHFASRGFPDRNGGSADPYASVSIMPFMNMPFALSKRDPKKIYFWANRSSTGSPGQGGGIFVLDATTNVTTPATLVFPGNGETIMAFTAGGVLSNFANYKDVVVAASEYALYVHTPNATNRMPFPTAFTAPCRKTYFKTWCASKLGLNWDACTATCSMWPNHFGTMSLAEGPNALTVAVTGWPAGSLEPLSAAQQPEEVLYFTRDGGATFVNIFGNLPDCAGVSREFSRVRPSGLAFVYPSGHDVVVSQYDGELVLLVGTVRGVCAAVVPSGRDWASKLQQQQEVRWTRLGKTTTEFPLVKVTSITFYPKTDQLLIATLGRGVYRLDGVFEKVLRSFPGISGITGGGGAAPSGGGNGGLIAGMVILALAVVGIAFFLWNRNRNQSRTAAGGTESQAAAYKEYAEFAGQDSAPHDDAGLSQV